MPDLNHTLSKLDKGQLRIICELWGINLGTNLLSITPTQMIPHLINKVNIQKLYASLNEDAQNAIQELMKNSGKLPWSLFSRKYGEVREIGAGQRDRKEIYLYPQNSTETLWYRSLINREFLSTQEGIEEFAYIPDEFINLFPMKGSKSSIQLGKPIILNQKASIFTADDRIIDHTCTYLALLRSGIQLNEIQNIPKSWPTKEPNLEPPYSLTPEILHNLLLTANIIDENKQPLPNQTRAFLELSRGDALVAIINSWLKSSAFNELQLIPGLIFEGDWSNDPVKTRHKLLDLIFQIPHNTWWSLSTFIKSIKENFPDFQRPSGDYDSWFIRDAKTNDYLRGFQSWELVDGLLIKFILGGPLHWLGFIDLAAPSIDAPVNAFRITKSTDELLNAKAPKLLEEEDITIMVQSNGTLSLPRLAPRGVRYQIARFCQWQSEVNDAYKYRITAKSLSLAKKQGLSINQFISLLSKNSPVIPPSLIKALTRWDEKGSEAIIEELVVLRVNDKSIIQKLMQSKASRFIDKPLGSNALVIKTGSQEKVHQILIEQGIISEI